MSGGDPVARTVLLVEDSDAILGAETGAEALRITQERLPDLVLLDMGLPDRSGLEVVRQIKAAPQTAGIAVVALTGRDEEADKRACQAAGCAAYIVKPVNTQKLVRDLPGWMAAAPTA